VRPEAAWAPGKRPLEAPIRVRSRLLHVHGHLLPVHAAAIVVEHCPTALQCDQVLMNHDDIAPFWAWFSAHAAEIGKIQASTNRRDVGAAALQEPLRELDERVTRLGPFSCAGR
jgi:hypothetical protein